MSVALRGTLESSGIVKLDVAIEYVVMASRVRVSKIAAFTFNTVTSFYFTSNGVQTYTKLQQDSQCAFREIRAMLDSESEPDRSLGKAVMDGKIC